MNTPTTSSLEKHRTDSTQQRSGRKANTSSGQAVSMTARSGQAPAGRALANRSRPIHTALLLLLGLVLSACAGNATRGDNAGSDPASSGGAAANPNPNASGMTDSNADPKPSQALETATFGAGCYWCVEAVLQQVEGVETVQSGFMGGEIANPSYEQVCSGTTGHAESVHVQFDPAVLSYEELLSWFWRLHDPTTLNQQGADRGTHYRSVIFYHSEAQRLAAEASKLAAASSFADPIVTEITEAGPFYEAKSDHQDFYKSNKEYGYCRIVIAPKLDKLGLDK